MKLLWSVVLLVKNPKSRQFSTCFLWGKILPYCNSTSYYDIPLAVLREISWQKHSLLLTSPCIGNERFLLLLNIEQMASYAGSIGESADLILHSAFLL